MKTLIKYNIPTRYSEIFQTISLLFSFVKKEGDVYTQLFQPVKCRDFLGDLIYSKKSGLPICIYGFNYSYKTHPYDEDMLRMSLTFPSSKEIKNFKNNFAFLNNKETRRAEEGWGLYMSQYHEVDKEPLTLIIEADPLWQSNTWKLSLFSYYLKLMSYPDVNKPEQPETQYAQKLTPEIETRLLSQLHVLEESLQNSVSMAHNYSGFVSIIGSSFGSQNPGMHTLLLGDTP